MEVSSRRWAGISCCIGSFRPKRPHCGALLVMLPGADLALAAQTISGIRDTGRDDRRWPLTWRVALRTSLCA